MVVVGMALAPWPLAQTEEPCDPRRSGLHSLWHPTKIFDISHNTNMPELSPAVKDPDLG